MIGHRDFLKNLEEKLKDPKYRELYKKADIDAEKELYRCLWSPLKRLWHWYYWFKYL